MTESTATRLAVVVLAFAMVGSVLVGGAVLAQQSSVGQNQQTSYVRVVHASPDAPPVDVYVDNESTLTNVSFGQVSDYLAVDSGAHNITVTLAGNRSATVIEENVTLSPRSVSTIAASGEATANRTELRAEQFTDDAFTPSANQSAIRVVHLSPDAPAVDVTVGNGSVVLADNVSFRNASDYVTVPAGNYTAEIRPATPGDDGPIVATVNVTLEGGKVYSAMAVGYLNPGEAPADVPFQVVATEDASTTVHLPPVQAQERNMNQTAAGAGP